MKRDSAAWLLSIAAVAGAVAGCTGGSTSSGTPSAGSTSSSAATSKASVSGTSSSQSPISSQNNPVPVTADPTFVGHWHVHGATMDIGASTATIVASVGPCDPPAQGMCHETDTLTIASGDSTQLTLKVTAVTYADSSGASSPNPSAGRQTAVGDTLQLTRQAPGLLKATILQGFPAWVGGNPYWCSQGISPSDLKRCGA